MKGRLSMTRSSHPRPAFTLVEVMFAVITLGIGLIMLAAIFPVAISQRKLTSEETNAAAVADQAMAICNQLAAYSVNFPVTTPATNYYTDPITGNVHADPGVIFSMRNPQVSAAYTTAFTNWFNAQTYPVAFNNVRGNFVLPSDPRQAWVALYRRDGLVPANPALPTAAEKATWSNVAQVIVIAAQARNTSVFSSADYTNATSAAATGIVNLQAKPIQIAITDSNPDTVAITASPAPNLNFTSAAVPGAYIVIADDHLSVATHDAGRMNGRVYKLGGARPDLDLLTPGTINFDLVPGNDFDPDVSPPKATITATGPNGLNTVDAFIVGMGLSDPSPTNPALTFSGPAMDIAVYTAYVPIH